MSKNRNTLFLSYDGLCDPLGQSQILPYLLGISAQEYQITIISFEKPDAFEKSKNEIENICKDNGIEWVPLKYHKNPPVLSTLYDIREMTEKALALHKSKNFSLVHCRSYIAALTGLLMKQKFGVPFLFDMRGFYPEERVDGNLWNLKNPLYKMVFNFFKRKEKEFLRQADHTVSLTYAAEKIIRKTASFEKIPITVIPCCMDEKLFTPRNSEAKNRAKTQLGFEIENKVLVYLGSLGTWYLTNEMLDFFSVYEKENPGAKFLIITKDSSENLQKTALEKGIYASSLKILPAERAEVPNLLAAADFGLFFIKPAYSKAASSPVKQGELMASGIPVFCNSGIGDSDFIIKKFHAGILVDELNETSYQKAIHESKNQVFEPEKLHQGAKNYFSLNKGIEQYLKIYSIIAK